MIEFDNLTYLHGKPQGTGLLKANPEDFVVVEDSLGKKTNMLLRNSGYALACRARKCPI